ncbi:exosome-associated family [Aspergillus sclerotialis]|uniref:Exosome complex protein n=1 Tax=Aspergillus sclerotialis TaxID=2070753 RepID=A0A3A2ZLP0_9EURO|nr:exosome-associated family [Aspergillus sclerotialis]
MEASDLLPLLDQLDYNVDDLEEVLGPLVNQSLAETSKKLPVLDKAKLNVLTTYALESLIYSYLKLRGVDAKQHPVFRELTRVRQYFDKIKALETEPEERPMTLNKQAAGRFIKHGLAGNERFDLERKEQEAKSKARAQLKAAMIAKQTTESGKSSSQTKLRSSEKANPEDSSDSRDEEKMTVEPASIAEGSEPAQSQHHEKKQKRKAKHEAAKLRKQQESSDKREHKKERRRRKLEKRKERESKQMKAIG